MEQTKTPASPLELAHLANTLPLCMIREAASGDMDLETRLDQVTSVFEFGDQIISIAGLAVSALYVAGLLDESDAPRDPILESNIGEMLGDRGYDAGLAGSVIQRAGMVHHGAFSTIVEDDRPVTDFLARPKSPGNIARSPVNWWRQLGRVLHHLAFLTRFRFELQRNAPVVLFDGQPLETRPFLEWDGEVLWRLRRAHLRMPVEVILESSASGTTITQGRTVGFDVLTRLRSLGQQLGLASLLSEPSQLREEEPPASVTSLFADSYPAMNRLARRLWLKSDPNTKFRLWLMPYSASERDAKAHITDERAVTNAIIMKCLDRDPISVLEEFFEHEPLDEEEFFGELIQDPGERERIQEKITAEAEEHENALTAFYCREEDCEEIKRQVDNFRARRVAQTIVRILGFSVVGQTVREGLTAFTERVRVFHDYVKNGGKDPARCRDGLRACITGVEELLTTLCLFYQILPFYSTESPDGVLGEGRSRAAEFWTEKRPGFGRLIGSLKKLSKSQEIVEAVRRHLGRDAIWPEGSHETHFKALNLLNDRRNSGIVHPGSEAGWKDASEFVPIVLSFLDWLHCPYHARGSGARSRIYPMLLFLNVVSTNNCGVSSVKYRLTPQGTKGRKEITLYTKQPVSTSVGSFLGLPHASRIGIVQDEIWLDPVLVSADLFGPRT